MAGLGIGVATGAIAHGSLYERHHLELTRASFPISGLPDALRGLRLGLITDIHRSQTVSHDHITTAVNLLMAERPDLIILGGDYVTWSDRHYVQPAAESLAGLSAPLGIIAILGNHDDDRDMPAALAAKGFTVLRDAHTRLRVRGESMDFIGIRYWTHKVQEIARLARGTVPHAILLAHTPKRLLEARQLAIPAGTERAHARRTDRPARRRRDCGARVSRDRWIRAPRQDIDLREPRGRHGVCAGTDQLPARGGRVDAGNARRDVTCASVSARV